jgi:hypothetical protein
MYVFPMCMSLLELLWLSSPYSLPLPLSVVYICFPLEREECFSLYGQASRH